MPSPREIQELAFRLTERRRATVQLWHGQLIVQPIVTTLVVQRARPACVVGVDDEQAIGRAVAEALEMSRRLPEEIPFSDVTPADAGVPVPADVFRLGAEVVDVDSYPDGVHVYPCRPLPDDPALRGRVDDRRISLPREVDADQLGAAVRRALEAAVPAPERRPPEAGDELEEGWVPPRTPTRGAPAPHGTDSNGSAPDDAAAAAAEAAAWLGSLGYEPDYSAGSIRAIDELVARELVAPGQPRTDGWLTEDLDRRVTELGAYLGETLRRELGGRWEGALGSDARVVLTGGTICWPIGRVQELVSEGPVSGGLAAYAAGLGAGNSARASRKRRLPRLRRKSPVERDLEPVPPSLERDVMVAMDADALLVWPVHMYELDLCFGRPIERLAESVDDASLGEAIRGAADSVRWAPARRDELSMAEPLYEPGSFAREAGLTTDERAFIDTLTAATASFTPTAVRIEPYLTQPGGGGLERATWLATEHDEPAPAAAIGQSVRSALGTARTARK